MQLGWIDFSKTERNKVLDVLDLLGERGVLDELGIAPIRDGFSDLFFPGTSTIQTRAKYFFIVPYAFRDLELNSQRDYFKLKKTFDDTEKNCAEALLDRNRSESGIIGRVSILNGKWVQRTPASIYWAGLRRYGIFKGRTSINQFIKLIAFQKQNDHNNKISGNRNDDGPHDDKNAGAGDKTHLLNIPTYRGDWFDTFDINLTADEGEFLKSQIILTCPDSMFAHILKENLWEVLSIGSFAELESVIHRFPKEIRNYYHMASSFSEFTYALRVIYNIIVSDNQNDKARRELHGLDLKKISDIDISHIMASLKIFNPSLKSFLLKSRESMENEDVEGLKEIIKSREIRLKGANRSRTAHPGEFDRDLWFAGDRLNYRFLNAKAILQDIHESENRGDI